MPGLSSLCQKKICYLGSTILYLTKKGRKLTWLILSFDPHMHIGSFLISTVLMFTETLLLHKSKFLHFRNNGLVIFNNL